jgi:hypothetical protein
MVFPSPPVFVNHTQGMRNVPLSIENMNAFAEDNFIKYKSAKLYFIKSLSSAEAHAFIIYFSKTTG